MSAPADVPNKTATNRPQPRAQKKPSAIGSVLSLPPRWLAMYDEFITKNAGQVSQLESGLRSLTYVIPGRFRDAEIASETVHSGVQLLSLYHDKLLSDALSRLPMSRIPSPHARYTRFWTQRSTAYRRVAMLLQMVTYTQLLCEMAAKRRGEQRRWRVVVLLEAVKAFCRLVLLRITRSRPLVTPVLPEREPAPEDKEGDDKPDSDEELRALMGEAEEGGPEGEGPGTGAGGAEGDRGPSVRQGPKPHEKDWAMPRTGMSLPSLPKAGDISGYLLGKVLTADDVKPATKLLNQARGSAAAAEVLHILAPLVYAAALAKFSGAGGNESARAYYSNRKNGGGDGGPMSSWAPWIIGVGVELAARQLRDDRGLRTTPLERDEWSRRAWGMGWWAMRGAFYERVTGGVVRGVASRVPSVVGGILEDYEYLWENYYFSTSA